MTKEQQLIVNECAMIKWRFQKVHEYTSKKRQVDKAKLEGFICGVDSVINFITNP